jgi:two-component system LytT family sensor kinase
MIKKIFQLISLILLCGTVNGQRLYPTKDDDSVLIAERGIKVRNYFSFAGYYSYPFNKTRSASSYMYMITDNTLYQIFDLIKPKNQKFIDSINGKRPDNQLFVSYPKSKILLGVKLNPGIQHHLSNGIRVAGKIYSGYVLNSNSEATIVAMGINKANVNTYRYHIVVNDSTEIVPWSIPKLEQQYGAKQPYAIIGRLKFPDKQALVEVVNTKDYSIRDGVSLDWRPDHQPVINSMEAEAYNDHFFIRPHHTRGYATRFDTATGLPLDLKFRVGTITRLTFDLKDHEAFPYFITLYRDSIGKPHGLVYEKNLTVNNYSLYVGNYDKPGKYQLVIESRYVYEKSQTLTLPFEILPPLPTDTFTVKQLVPYLALILAIAIGCFIYYRQKLRKANQQKAAANLKLNSVRAQLNPHFMFNALTSIQNLMNQHNLEGANSYLNKFAGLTRQVLNASGQELISLEDELQIISDYLQMEQLRFGFEYTINVDDDINKANTEIPTMLLQPFIENAAKHGVSGLQTKGKITVAIKKQQHNLVLTVADNGPGFNDAGNTEGGFGLKLSDERVELLNQVYKDQHVDLQINSCDKGAKITITLTNWL